MYPLKVKEANLCGPELVGKKKNEPQSDPRSLRRK